VGETAKLSLGLKTDYNGQWLVAPPHFILLTTDAEVISQKNTRRERVDNLSPQVLYVLSGACK